MPKKKRKTAKHKVAAKKKAKPAAKKKKKARPAVSKKKSSGASSEKRVLKKQKGTAAYEKKLLEMREDLVNLVNHKQETELTEQEVGDEADAAAQSVEKELLFELSDNERQTLDAIEAALRKIEVGSFGKCEGCMKPIPAPRLKAIPQARYCIQCQSGLEVPAR
jgi:DnaK suppressor protein